MTENERLLRMKSDGDLDARDKLICNNMGLVHSIALRFTGRGYDFEDLCQIGALGLIKAVDRFSEDYGVQFSTYAVPLIMGEIRKFLRDDGPIKVSRGLKELSARAMAEKAKMEAENEVSPTIKELAARLLVEEDRLLLALEASSGVKSIYEETDPESGEMLLDKLSDKGSPEEETLLKMAIKEGISSLSKKERSIILMRYFRSMTQSQTASFMGISQVQVSRIEKKAKEKLEIFMNQ
ncbi:MAG: SigB/SigF/SigG family RNA polymerase sigma factor [Clostridia bacterium]|nr:SigB/SigF/SigG family RNA polymerase sigma factor [Clostridia bacterium]